MESANFSEAKTQTMTHDDLKQNIGFLKTSKHIWHFQKFSNRPVQISHIDKSPKLNAGEKKPIKSPNMNKIPSPHSKKYGDIIHCNMGFGPVTVHDGVNYCLLFVDKATYSDITQSLKTLKRKYILKAFKIS